MPIQQENKEYKTVFNFSFAERLLLGSLKIYLKPKNDSKDGVDSASRLESQK
jgi:hypothetical protein